MREGLKWGGTVAAFAVMPLMMAQTRMPSKAEPISGTFLSLQASNQWLSSRLVGLPVYGANHDKIGAIDDLVIDQSGAIQAMVIGVGGFLGIGTKDIAVSLKSVSILRDEKGDRAISELSRSEIELAPSFQRYDGKRVGGLPSTSRQPQ